MTSKEGVIWCWKEKIDNTLFIFREEGQEIEVHFNNSYEHIMFNSNQQLTPIEREFLVSFKKEHEEFCITYNLRKKNGKR